jgi:hypothetical protein
MDINQRIELQKLCRENNVSDQTDLMRELKHSSIIRDEVDKIIKMGKPYNDDEEFKSFKFRMMTECEFLFTYYTDVFNRVIKNELDIQMLYTFLDTLKEIEDGNLDQHEASFKIGTILKEMYIDSALKTADNLNKKYENNSSLPLEENRNISWSAYKKNR